MSEESKQARNLRKVRRGIVVKKSGDKTISVLVERRYRHPVYGKQITLTKKYHTHDEKNEAAVGDTVTIMGCRPLSKLKRYRLVSVDKHATLAQTAAEAEEALEASEGSAAEVAPEAEAKEGE